MGVEILSTKEDEEENGRSAGIRAREGETARSVISGTESEEEEEEDEGEIVQAAAEVSEQQRRTVDEAKDLKVLQARPSVVLVGPSGAGKRSLLSRLIGRGKRSVKATTESGAVGHGWTIDTKYYTANVSIWVTPFANPSLDDDKSDSSEFGHCQALIMVFDLSRPFSFEQVHHWVSEVDISNVEIRLCVGNKADRVPDHFAHTEYRRKLQKKGESSSDPHPEFVDFGIDRSEGSSLLDEDGSSTEERRRSCIEWCSDHGFEYIEACAIDEVFDESLSVDGDLQGIARIHGALSACMWPGLIMKYGNEGNNGARDHAQGDSMSDDESDYYFEYELLSNGSAEPWEASGWEEQWNFSSHVEEPAAVFDDFESSSSGLTEPNLHSDHQQGDSPVTVEASDASHEPVSDESSILQVQTTGVAIPLDGHLDHPNGVSKGPGELEGVPLGKPQQNGKQDQEMQNMDKLMSEMVSMRMNVGSMSDQNRREMAARLAMRMASMFKEDGGEESD